jgi:hypothetical protein
MYCSKCGKEIDYDALVCRECEQAEQTASVETPAGGKPRMRGFGKALTGVILSFVAVLVSAVAYFASFTEAMLKIIRDYFGGDPMVSDVGMTVLFVLMAVPAVLAIVFGVLSIKTFKSAPAGQPKPIVTLIMGIYAIAESVSAVSMFLASLQLFSLGQL